MYGVQEYKYKVRTYGYAWTEYRNFFKMTDKTYTDTE